MLANKELLIFRNLFPGFTFLLLFGYQQRRKPPYRLRAFCWIKTRTCRWTENVKFTNLNRKYKGKTLEGSEFHQVHRFQTELQENLFTMTELIHHIFFPSKKTRAIAYVNIWRVIPPKRLMLKPILFQPIEQNSCVIFPCKFHWINWFYFK